MFTECSSLCSSMIEKLSELIKTEAKPEPWWKFLIKACYVKACLYARYSEIKLPRTIMQTVALPALDKFVEVLGQGADKDANYYRFEYRLTWAKIRSKLYFVVESNRLYSELIFDALKTYGMYDFPEKPAQAENTEQTAENLAKLLQSQLNYKMENADAVEFDKIKSIDDSRAIR